MRNRLFEYVNQIPDEENTSSEKYYAKFYFRQFDFTSGLTILFDCFSVYFSDLECLKGMLKVNQSKTNC